MGNFFSYAKRIRLRLKIGIALTLLGYFFSLFGAKPALFGLDRSPVFGFIQIAVMLLGLGLLCIGGIMSLTWFWAGEQLSIAADFGWRLVWSGFVIALWSAMADLWGFGTSLPKVLYFGPWQVRGVMAGQIVIAAGFLLLIPWKQNKTTLPPVHADGIKPPQEESPV